MSWNLHFITKHGAAASRGICLCRHNLGDDWCTWAGSSSTHPFFFIYICKQFANSVFHVTEAECLRCTMTGVVSLFFFPRAYAVSKAVINSRQCYLPHIRPPPFLLLPPPALSHLSEGDRIVRNRVRWLEGCQRGLACASDAGKCRHIFTFHPHFGKRVGVKNKGRQLDSSAK